MAANPPSPPAADAPAAASSRLSPKRRRLLLIAAVVFLIAAVCYGVYWFIFDRGFESTDDAYVSGNVIQVTPQVSGTVLAIRADDTDYVKAGQPLVKLDPADARVALDQAEAQLGQTVREVRGLYANNSTLEANVRLRQADAARAKSELERTQSDLARRQTLTATGAVSGEEINHAASSVDNAKSSLAAAQAGVAAAQENLVANRTLTEGVAVENHPNVQRAAARVREAYLGLTRVDLPAPVSGYVAKRSVQIGSRVSAGTPMMAIVPLDQIWVDANFKEVQLRNMRIGQPVTLHADIYGSAIDYHGHIVGLGVGTGAAFSLLPAQNATGNWIKVVQRIPVRIEIDPKELADHPLRIGLSMLVDINTRDHSGLALANAPRKTAFDTTAAFETPNTDADTLVARIIAENLGKRAGAAAALAAGASAAAPR